MSHYSNQNVVRTEPRSSLSRSPRAEGQTSGQVSLTGVTCQEPGFARGPVPPASHLSPSSGVQPDAASNDVPPVQQSVSRLRPRLAVQGVPADVSGQHLRLAHPLRAQTSSRHFPRHQHAAVLPLAAVPGRWRSGTGQRRECSSGVHPLAGGGEGLDGFPAAFRNDGGSATLWKHAAPTEPAAGVRSRPLRTLPKERFAPPRQPDRSVT